MPVPKKLIKYLLILIFLLSFVLYVKYTLIDHASECETSRQAIATMITQASECSIDSDCIAYTFTCPFSDPRTSCAHAINHTKLKPILRELGLFHKKCHNFCADCPTALPRVRCINKLCRLTTSN